MTKDFSLAIKQQLMKDNPTISEQEANERSLKIVEARKKANTKFDEDGMIVVGENVKLVLGANITSVNEIVEE